MVKDTLVAVLPARTSRQALRVSGCNVRVFCFFFLNKFYLFILGCTGSLLLCLGSLYLPCAGLSLQWPLLWQSTGPRVLRPQKL